MPYIVTRRSMNKKDVTLQDFLHDLVTLDMLQPPTKFQTTGTRTYYYDHISEEKLKELNIPLQIDALEKYYERFKFLDIENKQELYNTFYLPKKSSKPGKKKWRQIDAPNEELKNALSTLKLMFEALMDGCVYHTAAFAYIKNRCPKDAVVKHAQNKSNWYLKLDFSNFFGSINIDFAMRMLSEVYPFSEIVKNEQGKQILKKCLNLCFLNGGLPQGTPMSPILTNVIMIAIDHQLYNMLHKKRVVSPTGHKYSFVYTRYADDILISNKVNFDYKEIIQCVNRVLDKFNAPFKLNEEKTRYCSGSGANWILGVMLNQEHQITVGYKRKKMLKAMLANYMMDRKNGTQWSLEDIQHLQGELAYCMSIEKDTITYIISEYSKKFGDIKAAIAADIKKQAAV